MMSYFNSRRLATCLVAAILTANILVFVSCRQGLREGRFVGCVGRSESFIRFALAGC